LPDPIHPVTATRFPVATVIDRSVNKTLSGWTTPIRSASTQIISPSYGSAAGVSADAGTISVNPPHAGEAF
jgi:hypothetical protein